MRHSTSAGILRARIKDSTALAATFEPFQHPQLALERSGWAAIGSRGRRDEEEDEDGENATEQRQKTTAVAAEHAGGAPRACPVRKVGVTSARGSSEVEQQWSAQERELEEEERVRRKDPRPSPCDLYGRRGRGVGSRCGRDTRCGPVWPVPT